MREAQELLERRRRKQEETQKLNKTENTAQNIKKQNLVQHSSLVPSKKSTLTSTVKNSVPLQSSKTAALPTNIKKVKKAPLSYQETLELANKLNEEKVKSVINSTQTIKPTNVKPVAPIQTKFNEINSQKVIELGKKNESTSAQFRNVNRYLPGDIRSKGQQNNEINSINNTVKNQKSDFLKPQEKVKKTHEEMRNKSIGKSSICGQTTSIISSTDNLSAWDRVTANLKRKSVGNVKEKYETEPGYDNYYDRDEEEEEHDSDMDRYTIVSIKIRKISLMHVF